MPLLFKPTGRCKPVSNDKQLILSKWQVLTESYASREDFYRQMPLSMLFEQPAPIPWTNIFPGNALRIVNRLYKVPPPNVDDVWDSLEAQVYEPTVAPNTNATKRAASYDRRRWRRLGEHFASLHQLVLNAWQHWFPEVSLTCRRGKHRGIVLTNFTVPSTQLTIHEAAALGWGCSWLGIHFFAPKDLRNTPSLGVITWLAGLPERPKEIARHSWTLQVQKWLQEDMLRSHRLWLKIATFMHAQGSYLLLGSLAPSKAFARKHSVAITTD